MRTANSFSPFGGISHFFSDHTVRDYWGWFLALGLSLVVLGGIALADTALSTLVSIVLLGMLLIIGGFLLLLFAILSLNWRAAILGILGAILMFMAGWYLLVHPVGGALTFTLVMAWFFIFSGLFKLIGVVVDRPTYWGWSVASGIISLVVGVLLLAHWPVSGLFAIGLFIGIDLVVSGFSWIMAALMARRPTISKASAAPAV